MDRKDKIRFLRERPFARSWATADIEALADLVEEQSYRKGDVIFSATSQSDDAYLVYSGRVKQSILTPEHVEWWSLICNPGDAFVHQALYRGQGYASKAEALDNTVILRVPATVFSQLLSKHPELWSVIQNPLAARLQAIPLLRCLDDDQIQQFATYTTAKEFNPGEIICRADDPKGLLWIIDWGQVRVSEPDLGRPGDPSPAETPSPDRPNGPAGVGSHLLTAGNWFIGGRVDLPGLQPVSAEAVTKVRLIRIDQTALAQMDRNFPDFSFLLRHRLDMSQRLRQALTTDRKAQETFGDLTDFHWQQLATIAGWEHVPANLDVVRQGQYSAKMYVLSAGSAIVRATDDAGREKPRQVVKVGSWDVYGIDALLRGTRYESTLRSIVDANGARLPVDGSDWLSLQRDDVIYLLQTQEDRWRNTRLWQAIMVQPKQKKYRWQADEEEIVRETRRHILWLLLRLGMDVFIGLAVLTLLQLVSEILPNGSLTSLSLGLAAFVAFLLPALWHINDYFNDYYVITNQRILRHDRVLFIYENQLEAPIERIQDIVTRSSLIAKIFNYGWMTIATAGIGSIDFVMIPEPELVEGIIRGLQGAAKASIQAEQRENLRNKILSGLRIRLIPSIPPRALPPGTVAPAKQTGLQHAVQAIVRPWQRFWKWVRSVPEKLYMLFLKIVPARAREHAIREREERKRKRAAQMQDQIVYRKHVFFLLKAAIIPIAVIVGTIILVAFAEFRIRHLPPWIAVPYTGFLVVCVFWLWYRIENWRNDKYILTRSHIIYIYALPLGLFERRRQAEWSKVQNANYEVPSFWANLFNYGDVRVETASVEGVLTFEKIPNPRRVQQEIVLRIAQARQQAEQQERDRRLSDMSETLQIYSEALQEWADRNRQVGLTGQPGTPRPPAPL